MRCSLGEGFIVAASLRAGAAVGWRGDKEHRVERRAAEVERLRGFGDRSFRLRLGMGLEACPAGRGYPQRYRRSGWESQGDGIVERRCCMLSESESG